MKFAVLPVVLSASLSVVAAAAGRPARSTASGGAQPAPSPSDKIAEAYDQFLLGRHLEDAENDRRGDRGLQARDRARSEAADIVSRSWRRSTCSRTSFERGRHGGGAGAEDRAGQPRSATASSGRSMRRCPRTGVQTRRGRRRASAPTRTSPRRSNISSSAARSPGRRARSERRARRWRGCYVRAGVVRRRRFRC